MSASPQTLASEYSKKVLLTGGAKGIGREAVNLLLASGAHVTICGSSKNVDNEIERSFGPNAAVKYFQVDLSSIEETRVFAKTVAAENFDVYVLNAGTMAPLSPASVDGNDTTMSTNVLSSYIIVSEVLKNHQEGRSMHFVFMTSILIKFFDNMPLNKKVFNPAKPEDWFKAMQPTKKSGTTKYTISKLGQAAMATFVNAKKIPGVTATTIHPGCVITSMMDNLPRRQQMYLKMMKSRLTTKEQAGEHVVNAIVNPLAQDLFYNCGKAEKLPSIIHSEKTLNAFVSFFEQFKIQA